MLKKLQRKIVLMNMLMVGIVLTLVFSLFTVNAIRNEERQISAQLSQSGEYVQRQWLNTINAYITGSQLSEDPYNLAGDSDFLEDSRPNSPLATQTAILTRDGYFIKSSPSGLRLTGPTLTAMTSYALEHPSSAMAECKELCLFYKTMYRGAYVYVTFTGTTNYYIERRSNIISSLFLWGSTMAFFLLISIILARFAVRPVKQAWDRQQEFVADASHELKTPLAVMMANNNILLSPKKNLPPEMRKWVESNRDEAEHMQTLVEHLLFLARNDYGEQKLLMEALDLSDLLEEDILQFEPVAYERRVSIESNIVPHVTMQGDATMMKQLIHILLDNACKYAAEGTTVTAKLTAGTGDRATGHNQGESLAVGHRAIALAIHNEGAPIPAEDLPHIFERFYRADKSRTHNSQAAGYGLGLSIAKSIAKDHGGDITCTSTTLGGTTFTVRFK